MSYAIKIQTNINKWDNTQEWEWSKDCNSKQEIDEVRKLCQGRDCISIIPAMLVTVRTSNPKDFAKDFFLPTLFNHALKINNTALKILAGTAATLLDILTLIVRAVTLIPRLKHNAKHAKEQHPLYEYLKAQGVAEQILKADRLKIRLEWEGIDPSCYSSYPLLDGTVVHKQQREQNWNEERINFIQFPIYAGHDQSASGAWSLSTDL